MSYVQYANINGRRTARELRLGDVASDIENLLLQTGKDVVDTGQNDLTTGGGDLAQQLINSSQFKIVLDKVEERARDGVKAEASKNAIALALLAAGAGTVGGAILKGKIGMLGTAIIVGGSLLFIVSNSNPSTK